MYVVSSVVTGKRQMGKLTVAKVRSAGPGRHGDGDGLYLVVKPGGARSWVLRIQQGLKRTDIGLGAALLSEAPEGNLAGKIPLLQRRLLTLAEARQKARELRQFSKAGLDPIAERDRTRNAPKVPTFAEAMKEARAELGKGWSDKTAAAFEKSLTDHAVPTLGARLVDGIDGADIVTALAPIWTAKPEQARKVRHRVLQVLSFAKARGWRKEPVPLPGEMKQGLAKQPRSSGFAAVPYAEVPDLVAGELAKADSPGRLALLFTILTAARSGEVRAARWDQIDREAKTWTRPAAAMKSGKLHVVTLSPAALAVLDRAAELGGAELVFPAARGGVLSDAALAKILRMAGRAETVHGFRSSFRDWAAEKMPAVPAMVAEMALAHSVGTATEQAYLRSDMRAMRFELMEAWGRFAAPSISGGRGND